MLTNESEELMQKMPLLKVGEISSVNPANMTARVVFDDEDSLVSGDLQIVIPNSFANKDYRLPDIGEDAVCIFLGTGVEDGFILGSIYAGQVLPHLNSADKRGVLFSDGSTFEYDRSSSTMSIRIGSTSITATPDTVTVETSNEVNGKAATVNIEGESVVNVNGGTTVNITTPTLNLNVGGTTMVLNGSSATIVSDSLVLKGTMTITGDLTVYGDTGVEGDLAVNGRIDATGKITGA